MLWRSLLENLTMHKTGIPNGSDTSSGTYRCDDCGHVITKPSNTSLQVCPNSNKKDFPTKHTKFTWTSLSGQGDAAADPYPNGK